MPPTFNWLPPLRLVNDGHEAHTTVEISQTEPYVFDKSLRHNMITMSFEANVCFVSGHADHQNNFIGLAIEDCFLGKNLKIINEEILRSFPYFGERITFTENHYDEEDGPTSYDLSSAGEVFQRIEEFLRETMEKEYNDGVNEYSVELKIQQEIAISDERLKLWHSWLAAMNESEYEEWSDGITRPRTEEELMNMATDPAGSTGIIQVVDMAQSCPICLDDISVGSTAIKLSCGHIFGDDCLKKWLESSDTCPMCRSCILMSSFEHLL